MAISLNFFNAITTTSSMKVSLVDNSASCRLDPSEGVWINGTLSFNSLSITQTQIVFGVAPGTQLNAAITLNVIPYGSSPPVILVSNLNVDSATVTYPTDQGPETQVLIPGEEMVLSGFVVD